MSSPIFHGRHSISGGDEFQEIEDCHPFVDTARYRGACYQAANWRRVGETTGRTRQDRWNTIHVPPKLVFVYPLNHSFRAHLRA